MTLPPLRVTEWRAEAKDVVLLTLASVSGQPLPAQEPGAHLEWHLPNGLVRQYSLCGDPSDSSHYLIGVGRAASSRGGSEYIHQHVRVGTEIRNAQIRNNFRMDSNARRNRFIAGGIGITPIMSMVRQSAAQGLPWSLTYCTRSRNRAAFLDVLAQYPEAVRYHVDEESNGQTVDLVSVLGSPSEGEHLYCCGPAPLMEAVQAGTSHWPSDHVHFEWFSAPADAAAGVGERKSFVAILKRSGQRVEVGADTSLLEALEQNGVDLPFSCREGLCRTCEIPLCGGEAEHLDHVLSEAEKASQCSIIACVSRARTPELVLDL